MKKMIFIILFIFYSSLLLCAQENPTKSNAFFRNENYENWAFKIGIDGMIIDLSEWGSYLAVKKTSLPNVFLFGIGLDLDFLINENKSNNTQSFGGTFFFEYNRYINLWKVSPYFGTGICTGFEYYKNTTKKTFTESIIVDGILGAEIFCSEHMSFFIEYRLECKIDFDQNPDSDNNTQSTSISVNATNLMLGIIIYFGN